MTSGHPYIADFFPLIGGGLLTIKFFTWEVPKNHQKKRFIYGVAILISLVILI
jgi:hypothetical protein